MEQISLAKDAEVTKHGYVWGKARIITTKCKCIEEELELKVCDFGFN